MADGLVRRFDLFLERIVKLAQEVVLLGADGVPQFDGRYALFPGMDFDYKIGFVYSAGVQVQQPIYQGGKIIAANRIAGLTEQMSMSSSSRCTVSP